MGSLYARKAQQLDMLLTCGLLSASESCHNLQITLPVKLALLVIEID